MCYGFWFNCRIGVCVIFYRGYYCCWFIYDIGVNLFFIKKKLNVKICVVFNVNIFLYEIVMFMLICFIYILIKIWIYLYILLVYIYLYYIFIYKYDKYEYCLYVNIDIGFICVN